MTQEELFKAYYGLYRTQAQDSTIDQDEFKIFINLANEAITR